MPEKKNEKEKNIRAPVELFIILFIGVDSEIKSHVSSCKIHQAISILIHRSLHISHTHKYIEKPQGKLNEQLIFVCGGDV